MDKHRLKKMLVVVLVCSPLVAEAASYMPERSRPRIDLLRDDYTYAGIDLSGWNLEIDRSGSRAAVSANGIGVRTFFGRKFSDYLAAEAQLMAGGKDDNAQLDRNIGVFVRATLPFKRIQLKALAGFSASEFTLPGYDNSYSGLSWGIGAELTVWKDIWMNTDYTRYYTSSDTTFDAVNLGMGIRW